MIRYAPWVGLPVKMSGYYTPDYARRLYKIESAPDRGDDKRIKLVYYGIYPAAAL
jgi:hypothetical protein